MEVLRLIDDITQMGIAVNSVVITNTPARLRQTALPKSSPARGVKNYIHPPHQGLPHRHRLYLFRRRLWRKPVHRDGKAPCGGDGAGPRLWQLATCLSQVYHESAWGAARAYAKFETFRVEPALEAPGEPGL